MIINFQSLNIYEKDILWLNTPNIFKYIKKDIRRELIVSIPIWYSEDYYNLLVSTNRNLVPGSNVLVMVSLWFMSFKLMNLSEKQPIKHSSPRLR